jgi:regulator of protease activity HflC (stomatin/prohibitin superfamily)
MSKPYVSYATTQAALQLKAQQARIDEAREALANANAMYAEENAARLARQKSRQAEGTTMYDQAKVDAYFPSSGTIGQTPYVTTSNSGFGGSKSMRRNRRLKRARKTRRGRVCSHKRSCRCCRCRNSRK